MVSPQSISSLFYGGIFSRRVLFTFHLCPQNKHVLRKNTQEEFNREKKIILDLPFPCREMHCPHCENFDVYVQGIADLSVVLINYHAIEISSLSYNWPL